MWLDTSESLTKKDYEEKLTEVNGTLNPIMMKIYSEGGGSMPEAVPQEGSMPSMSSMPTVDEVD